jgi:thiol-disulfide isomerase/thioredoxin
MKGPVCFFMLLALSVSLVSTQQLFAVAEPVSVTASKANELLIGIRAFAFIVQAECSACEQVVQWFADAAKAFPEIQLAFVSPSPATESVETSGGAIPIIPDKDGLLAVALGVARAPTVIVASDETTVARLDWPFSREDLFDVLTAQRPRNTDAPNPEPHLTTRSKELVTVNLHGKRTALVDLPFPMLVAFLNLGCPACMDLLPLLQRVSADISTALVAIPPAHGGLSTAERQSLETLQEETRPHSVVVLIDASDRSSERTTPLVSPTFLLVDRNGVIIGQWEGVVDEKELREAISATSAGTTN